MIGKEKEMSFFVSPAGRNLLMCANGALTGEQQSIVDIFKDTLRDIVMKNAIILSLSLRTPSSTPILSPDRDVSFVNWISQLPLEEEKRCWESLHLFINSTSNTKHEFLEVGALLVQSQFFLSRVRALRYYLDTLVFFIEQKIMDCESSRYLRKRLEEGIRVSEIED